jgi:hypothetical protein
MPTLHVRDVPPDVYESLQQRARERRTSIAKETIRLLAQALRVDRPGVRELIEAIERDRPVARRGTPSAAELIREDRQSR